MPTTLRTTTFLLLATTLVTAACSRREAKPEADSVAIADSASAAIANAGSMAQRAMQRAGVTQNVSTADDPDAVVIRTTDNAISLALANDTVSMGLSDSSLTKAHNDMAKDTAEKGMGGALSKFIQKTVSKALQSRIAYPVQDLESAKYENGAIVFTYRVKRQVTFENVSSDHHKALQSFAPADAKRFVAAVDSAIAEARGQ